MFTLYCLCKFRNQFTEMEPLQEFQDVNQAIWAARNAAMQKRVPVRVVDDQGTMWFEASFPFRG